MTPTFSELRLRRLRRVREQGRVHFREAHSANLRAWRKALMPDEWIAGHPRPWNGVFYDLGDDTLESRMRPQTGPSATF